MGCDTLPAQTSGRDGRPARLKRPAGEIHFTLAVTKVLLDSRWFPRLICWCSIPALARENRPPSRPTQFTFFTHKGAPVSEQTVQTGLSDNAASGLAYVTFIPAIVFLVTAPYNQNKTIRFHSWQSIFLFIACVAIDVALSVLLRVPFLGFMTLLLWPLVGLAFFIVWILLLIKAFNGQRFKLPIIGDLAEKQASGAGI
jgi:uncharacterized membrane protein